MARFTCYDIFLVCFTTLSYVADVATDIALIAYFYSSGHPVWAALTLVFVAVSALMMQVFSFHWHVADKSINLKTFIIHILFLAPLHRYVNVLRLGMKSRESKKDSDVDAAYRQLNDVCILRLFETFIEAAPQLVLQLYIVLSDLDNFNTLLGFSMFFSVFSVSWAVTAYTDALHIVYKKLYKRRFLATMTHLMWQTGMITARVISIVLFATAVQAFVAIPIALHFLVMLVWILRLNPEFGSQPCEKRLFAVVASVIHVFCFLNLKEGKSRYRMAFYYILVLLETCVLMTIWYMCKTQPVPIWYDVTAFSVVLGSFGFGTLCMLLYYGCCHTSGPAPILEKKPQFLKASQHTYRPAQIQKQHMGQKPLPDEKVSNLARPSIFDVSSNSTRINNWLHASLDLSKEGLVDNPDTLLDPALGRNPGSNCHNGKQQGMSMHSASNGSIDKPLLNGSRNRSGITSVSHSDQELSVQDNIIQLFSNCSMDPSFVSNTSMIADDPANLSRAHTQGQQDHSITEIINNKIQHSRLSNDSTQSLNNTDRKSLSPQYQQVRYYNDQPKSLPEIPFSREGRYSRVSSDSKGSVVFETTFGAGSNDASVTTAKGSRYNRREQNNSLTEISMRTAYQSRLSNDSSTSVVYENSPVLTPNTSRHDHSKLSMSPLDPSKLWEETASRLSNKSSPRYRDCNNHSASSYNTSDSSGNSSAVLTVTPDEARGITHLSLSYPDLNVNTSLDHRRYAKKQNRSTGSRSVSLIPDADLVRDTGKELSDSKLVSFSNMSLPLPDESRNSRYLSSNQPDIVSRLPSEDCTADTSTLQLKKASATLNRSREQYSGVSVASRDTSTGNSYTSDLGLSTSDRIPSSASNNKYEMSSGFQSYGSDTSNNSSHACPNNGSNGLPLCDNSIQRHAGTTENEILSMSGGSDAAVACEVATSEEDNEVESIMNISGGTDGGTPPCGTGNGVSRHLSQHILEKEADTMESPRLPPIRLPKRRSSADRFFKDPTLDDATFTVPDESCVPLSSTRRRSNIMSDTINSLDMTNASSFQWFDNSNMNYATRFSDTGNQSTDILEVSDQSPVNFLKLAGKDVLSFSLPSYPLHGSASVNSQDSGHSYSDSIPWEDAENKSSLYQKGDHSRTSSIHSQDSSSVLKPARRQALRSLENTPVISPIYGQDNNRQLSKELISRKRFMSTPKLPLGTELNTSSKSARDNSSLMLSRLQTYGDNTSTWSSNSGSDSRNQSRTANTEHPHADGTFALSDTVYI